MFRKHIVIGFMGLALAGGAVACERQTAKTEIGKSDKSLEDRLDRVENDWIRLKGELQGKSEAEQELAVLKDEIEEELSGAKKSLKSLGDSAEKGGEKAKESLEKTIDKLERSLEKAKKDLS